MPARSSSTSLSSTQPLPASSAPPSEADPLPLEVEVFPAPPAPTGQVESYRTSLAMSRERAQELTAKRVSHRWISPNQASVEVYKQEASDDSGEAPRTYIHMVTRTREPWEFEGWDQSEASEPRWPLGKNGPAFVEITLTQCPGGYCPVGCWAFKGGVTLLLQYHRGELSLVPHGDVASRSELGDYDDDGAIEFHYSSPNLVLDTCDGAWCCSMKTGPFIERYVGWDGSRWSETLPRLRHFYLDQEKKASKDIDALRLFPEQSGREVRCQLAIQSTRLLWLAEILGRDRSTQVAQWQEDTKRFSPADCYPLAHPGEPDIQGLVLDRAQVLSTIQSAKVLRLFE